MYFKNKIKVDYLVSIFENLAFIRNIINAICWYTNKDRV
jgi:hypothetical protein